MARLAILVAHDATHDRVKNIIAGEPADYPALLDVSGLAVSPGDLRDKATGEFSTPVDPTPTLTVTLSATETDTATPVAWTAEVRDGSGELVPISGTYRVPLVRSADGYQVTQIKAEVNAGQASGNLTVPLAGSYVLRMDLITPVPQSRLGTNLNLDVDDV